MGARELRALPGRLDAVLAGLLGVPRADAQRLIAEGRVRVEGVPRPKSFRLAGGERLEVDLGGAGEVPPEGPPPGVAYEDPHLLVVRKPAGLPTHPTAGRREGTFVNRLLALGVPLSRAAGPLRPGIVHRLDAGTSGLLLVAKDDETHAGLSGLFRRHEVERRYVALVRGRIEHDRFAVRAPLGRAGARIVVRPAGREAQTDLSTLERFDRATLLEAAPRTGRTHQIRVHLAAVGHPILGDARYGGGGEDARRLGLSRPFLHAAGLSFVHPRTGERVRLEDPLPDDLRTALERLRGAPEVDGARDGG
ncbi:MAG TPA: RluA family pseudouridine synthase [Actinomycetota bacterium]|nr:RluA family pseudouridine synthase [Actinomycetota bacterium]